MKLWQNVCAAAMASVLLAMGVSGGAVHAALRSSGGAIAVTKITDGVPNIWRTSTRGDDTRPLTRLGAHSPAWSPDGRQLVFVTLTGALGVMRADGSGLRYLSNSDDMKDSSPVWSADGSKIAFIRTISGSGKAAVFVMQPDGRGIKNISAWTLRGNYRAPSWAPDSTQLVYEYAEPNKPSQLRIASVRSTKDRLLTTTSDSVRAQPQWSSSGKKILFQDSASEVYTIHPNGSSRSVISDGDSRSARWSPDGSRIAFVEDDNISIAEQDGTVASGLLAEGAYKHVNNLAWASDGGRILFAGQSTVHGATSGLFLVRMAADNQMPVKLLNGVITDVAWRPGVR